MASEYRIASVEKDLTLGAPAYTVRVLPRWSLWMT